MTRHINIDELEVHKKKKKKDDDTDGSEKKAKTRGRKSRRSLISHLSDLHLLLRSTLFSTWPLTIRFYAADVHQQWRGWADRVDRSLPVNMIVLSDPECLKGATAATQGTVSHTTTIREIPVDYRQLHEYLEKTSFLLVDPQNLQCSVCHIAIVPQNELIVVCPAPACHGTSHVQCLADHFLAVSGTSGQLLPVQGPCPTCQQNVSWTLLMKELSLRTRGQDEVKRILKRLKRQKVGDSKTAKPKTTSQSRQVTAEPDARQEQSRPQSSHSDTGIPSDKDRDHGCDQSDLDDAWLDDVDIESDVDTRPPSRRKDQKIPDRLEIVIEDSEGDEMEIID